jgi:hypothetical protein
MTWDTQHKLNATKLHSHWLNRCPWYQIGKQDSFHNKRSPVSKYYGLQMRQALAPRQFHQNQPLRISSMWFWACHPVCNKRMWPKEKHRQKLSVFALKRRSHWNSARFFNWICLFVSATPHVKQKCWIRRSQKFIEMHGMKGSAPDNFHIFHSYFLT